MLYNWNKYNIVNQLYFNEKEVKLKNKEIRMHPSSM